MNAFLIFCKRHRAVVRDRYPHLENRSITKILGEWWANLETAEKASYTELAKQYKEAFLRANPDFKWYKLPAPPLRTLMTRPSNQNKPNKFECQLTCGPITPGKLADESQMGGLSSLLSSIPSQTNTSPSPPPPAPKPPKKRYLQEAALGCCVTPTFRTGDRTDNDTGQTVTDANLEDFSTNGFTSSSPFSKLKSHAALQESLQEEQRLNRHLPMIDLSLVNLKLKSFPPKTSANKSPNKLNKSWTEINVGSRKPVESSSANLKIDVHQECPNNSSDLPGESPSKGNSSSETTIQTSQQQLIDKVVDSILQKPEHLYHNSKNNLSKYFPCKRKKCSKDISDSQVIAAWNGEFRSLNNNIYKDKPYGSTSLPYNVVACKTGECSRSTSSLNTDHHQTLIKAELKVEPSSNFSTSDILETMDSEDVLGDDINSNYKAKNNKILSKSFFDSGSCIVSCSVKEEESCISIPTPETSFDLTQANVVVLPLEMDSTNHRSEPGSVTELIRHQPGDNTNTIVKSENSVPIKYEIEDIETENDSSYLGESQPDNMIQEKNSKKTDYISTSETELNNDSSKGICFEIDVQSEVEISVQTVNTDKKYGESQSSYENNDPSIVHHKKSFDLLNGASFKHTDTNSIKQTIDYSSNELFKPRRNYNSNSQIVPRKSLRAGKGKRYREFMSEGILAVGKRSRKTGIGHLNMFSEQTETKSEEICAFTNNNADSTSDGLCLVSAKDDFYMSTLNTDSTSSSEKSPTHIATHLRKHKQFDIEEDPFSNISFKKRFKAADFNLDEKIEALPHLSLEDFQLKKKARKKRIQMNQKKSDDTLTVLIHSTTKPTSGYDESTRIKENSEKELKPLSDKLSQPVLVGSQKRKARKQSITHLGTEDARAAIDTSVVEPDILNNYGLRTLADVASSKEKLTK